VGPCHVGTWEEQGRRVDDGWCCTTPNSVPTLNPSTPSKNELRTFQFPRASFPSCCPTTSGRSRHGPRRHGHAAAASPSGDEGVQGQDDGRAGLAAARPRVRDGGALPVGARRAPPRDAHLLPAVQGAARRRVGAGGGGAGEHGRAHGGRVPPRGRDAAQHQPLPQRRPRRHRPRAGRPRPRRPLYPGSVRSLRSSSVASHPDRALASLATMACAISVDHCSSDPLTQVVNFLTCVTNFNLTEAACAIHPCSPLLVRSLVSGLRAVPTDRVDPIRFD
jgi:hypothetical protein